MQEEQTTFLEKIEQKDITKIICSNGKGEQVKYRKICILPKKNGWQIESYTEKQVFHENIETFRLKELCNAYMEQGYRQIDIFTETAQYTMKVSKKGKLFCSTNQGSGQSRPQTAHNRTKNYLLREG